MTEQAPQPEHKRDPTGESTFERALHESLAIIAESSRPQRPDFFYFVRSPEPENRLIDIALVDLSQGENPDWLPGITGNERYLTEVSGLTVLRRIEIEQKQIGKQILSPTFFNLTRFEPDYLLRAFGKEAHSSEEMFVLVETLFSPLYQQARENAHRYRTGRAQGSVESETTRVIAAKTARLLFHDPAQVDHLADRIGYYRAVERTEQQSESFARLIQLEIAKILNTSSTGDPRFATTARLLDRLIDEGAIPHSLLLLDRVHIGTELPMAEEFFLGLDEVDAKALPKSDKAGLIANQYIRQLLEKYRDSLTRDSGLAEDLLFELFPNPTDKNRLDFAKLIELANSLRAERGESTLSTGADAAGEAFFEVLGMVRTSTAGEELSVQERQDVVFSEIVGTLLKKAARRPIKAKKVPAKAGESSYEHLRRNVREQLLEERQTYD